LIVPRSAITIDQLDRINLPGLAVILTRLPCSLVHYLLIEPRNRKRPRIDWLGHWYIKSKNKHIALGIYTGKLTTPYPRRA